MEKKLIAPLLEENLLQALGALEEVDRVMHLVNENVNSLTGGLRKLALTMNDAEMRVRVQECCDAIDAQMVDALSASSQNAGNFGVGYLSSIAQ